MGQGQDVHARRLMNQFTVNGGWVLLQNCHLSLDYIEEVMDQVVETENIHPTFRLWVTTEMHPKFPITFLQVTQLASKILYLVSPLFSEGICKLIIVNNYFHFYHLAFMFHSCFIHVLFYFI